MATNIPKFRLLRLPLLARENVLQTMDWFDIITISHCSKNFKLFVKSLKIKSKLLHVNISNEIVVDTGVRRWPKLLFQFEETGNPLEAPCKLGINYGGGRTFKVITLTVRDWLNHLSEIFHCTKVALYFFQGSEAFDVESLQNTFRGLTIHTLNIVGAGIHSPYVIKLMETFLPVEIFALHENPFPDLVTLQKAIRDIEFNQLTFISQVPVTLPDILVLNAIDIEIWRCPLTENDLNVLFRVWKSGWNQKLSYLFMKFPRDTFSDDYETTILDGLGAVKNEEEKYFKGRYNKHKIHVKGGYDIKKCDGTNATILFFVYGRVVDVHFMIWK
ncbi:unnamed protein product [Caenorhabditis brenneri]